MRRVLLLGGLVVALTLTACGGGDDDDGAAPEATSTTRATTTTTTTTEATPDEQFLEEVGRRMTFGEEGGPASALNLAHQACDTMDATSADAMAADDAANDSAASDAAIAETMTAMGLATVFEGVGNDDAAALVLVLATEYFCPQHTETVEDFIASRGVEVPTT